MCRCLTRIKFAPSTPKLGGHREVLWSWCYSAASFHGSQAGARAGLEQSCTRLLPLEADLLLKGSMCVDIPTGNAYWAVFYYAVSHYCINSTCRCAHSLVHWILEYQFNTSTDSEPPCEPHIEIVTLFSFKPFWEKSYHFENRFWFRRKFFFWVQILYFGIQRNSLKILGKHQMAHVPSSHAVLILCPPSILPKAVSDLKQLFIFHRS